MYDFIISGAGLAGALIANVLQKKGYSVFIFDKIQSISYDGRTSAISYGSKNILEKFGLWEGLKPFTSPMLDIYTSSSSKGLFYLHFSSEQHPENKQFYQHQKNAEKNFTTEISSNQALAYTLPNHALQKVLYENIDINFASNYKFIDNSPEKVSLTLEDGRVIEGKILLCAEGRNSPMRTNFKIPTYKKKYSQYAITCSVSHKQEHKNVAQEIFYQEPFALLPLQDPHQSSLIFTTKADFANLMFKLKDEEFIDILNKKCNIEIDGIISKKFIFPLSLTFALKYSIGRILFMGDSIHSIHPVAGQGLNLTIYDLNSLVNSIDSFDIYSEKYKYIFSRFFYERFDENLKMALFTDNIIKLFAMPSSSVDFIRNIAISFINGNNTLKNFFIKKAIGYEK